MACATFLRDGRIAGFGTDGGKYELQIFAKPRDGLPLEKEVATTVNSPEYISAANDGHWVAGIDHYESTSTTIGLWKLGEAHPQRIAKFVTRSNDGNVPTMSFSPDAHWFCFTDNSQNQSTIHLIDLRGDMPREASILKADADEKTDAPAKGFYQGVFLSDGRLATADRNGRTWFWKTNDGEPQRVGSIRDIGFIAAAAESLRVAVYPGDGAFRVWDLATDPPKLLGTGVASFVADHIGTLAIAPNGETVFTGHANGAIRLWNVSQAEVTEIDPLPPNPRCHGGRPKVVNHFLCASSESQRVGLWRPTRDGFQTVPEASPSLAVLAASPAQQQLIVAEGRYGSGGTGIALLRCDAERVMPARRINVNGPGSAALNDEGRHLAIGRHNGTEHVVELWGWESEDLPARKLSEIKSFPAFGWQLAFADAGHTLVGLFGVHVQIWDVKDDQLVPRTTLPPHSFRQFAVAPDGQTLAAVDDNSLEIWNLKSDLAQPITTYAVPGTGAVAISPDGRRLASSFWENGASAGVQIIQLASGVVEKRLTFPGRVHELTFTDDSRHLITGNANATIYVVRLEPAPTKPSVTSAATTTPSPKRSPPTPTATPLSG